MARFKRTAGYLAGWLLWAGLGANALGQPDQPPPDKSGFTLFRPTPAEFMREMSADRPDKTDSPYTVDAGHFQLEMDIANTTRSVHDGIRTERYQVAPINLKLGVLNRMDLQCVLEPWAYERTGDGGR